MVRHKSFASVDDLGSFLKENVPSDVYYSCAYYENPGLDMDKKGWLGADLVFDIDADHIPTRCKKIHDEWTCSSCNFNGKGVIPEKCPICGSQKFDVKAWPCDLCLNSAKEETIKLLDMLTQDFGFSNGDISVFFSGHRGYHVQIENEAVKKLDAIGRKEIVDYVSGLGLDLSADFTKKEKQTRQGPGLEGLGWRRRLKLGMRDFILNAEEEDLRKIGIRRNLTIILKNKEAILKRCLDAGNFSGFRDIGVETWKKIAEYAARSQSARVDTVVTTDIHRLIRLAGTLHGKTGLRKVNFPASHISDFDPFKEAVAFKRGAAKIFVHDAPEFRLGDSTFGPYKNQKVELPTAAALLLVCKGRAEVLA
jgi:DNA primase small subunit